MVSRLSTCESTATSAKQLADSNSSRITACENKDSAQDVSIQNPTVGLSLNTDTKILTVTVNGTSQTIDLSGISGGMKLVTKEYSEYSDFYNDIPSFPKGTRVLAVSRYCNIDTVLNGGYVGPLYGGSISGNNTYHALMVQFNSDEAAVYLRSGASSPATSSSTPSNITVQYWE